MLLGTNMDQYVIAKLINELPPKIDRLLDLKEIDEFSFSLQGVSGGTSGTDFTILFRCGYYVPNGTAGSDEAEFYVKLHFSGMYKIFYDLNELTYSEQHLGIVENEDEETRVTKRIIALVWALYKYVYNEMEKPDSPLIDSIIEANGKTGVFIGDWRSAETPLGSVRFQKVY